MTQPISISLPTSTLQTSRVMLRDGEAGLFRLESVTQSAVPDKGDKIEFRFALTQPMKSSTDKLVNPGEPGSVVVETLCFWGKDFVPGGPVPERLTRNVCRIIDALLGTAEERNSTGKPTRPDFTGELVPQLIGKEMFAKIKHRQSDDYTNVEFARMHFPGDVMAG